MQNRSNLRAIAVIDASEDLSQGLFVIDHASEQQLSTTRYWSSLMIVPCVLSVDRLVAFDAHETEIGTGNGCFEKHLLRVVRIGQV